ncbi:uncharacterized protein LOC6575341 [Drosophila mojavensis]|uniref:Uncharacterized protein, isoform D n=2 Tax=Drosophila mojavensis TaxID=7230 RepID=B4KAS7_DROMO|nr:uncharacterized protein LOC6575341 [Drosophila mojavensis]EDW16814.2 uncharacterized protein Dmoj_GI22021, isoform D [Drosophila mojavensis]
MLITMSATRAKTITTKITTIKSANNWRWICLCCFVCLAAAAQANSSSGSSNGSGSKSSPVIAKDATHIYKIKRQDKYQQPQKQQQQLPQQLQLRGSQSDVVPAQQQKQLKRRTHALNKKLLSKLGFVKVKAPNSHNRKRLAVESRRHSSRDDSHMFIIKLPPNLHYYSGPNSVQNTLDAVKGQQQPEQKKPQQQQQQEKSHQMSNNIHDNAPNMPAAASEASALKTNGKKVSFPFSSNGRPARIYHWNLPVLKQALQKNPHFAHVSAADRNRLLDIEKIPTWRKPWENDTIEKSFTAGSGKAKYRKSLKQKSPTYYAPSQVVNKQSFHKYFAGNGKPKGLYVIKEHQTKPQFYQNIIS